MGRFINIYLSDCRGRSRLSTHHYTGSLLITTIISSNDSNAVTTLNMLKYLKIIDTACEKQKPRGREGVKGWSAGVFRVHISRSHSVSQERPCSQIGMGGTGGSKG